MRKPAAAAGADKPAWRRHLLPVLGLWALALAAYSSSFGAGLVFDNRIAILNDPRIQDVTSRNANLILDQQYWYGNLPSALYRPLTTFSYLFNYAVLGNGSAPAGYHWVNFALHAVNIALVYVLALWIFGELRAAVATAAVWAVHPVLTESVTNIVGRADLLAALGVLAALACHVHAAGATGKRRMRWLVAVGAATAIGMFSKESAIVAPAVLLLYDLAFAGRGKWRERVDSYAAAVAPCLLFLCIRAQVLAHSTTGSVVYIDNPLVGAGFLTGRLTAIGVIGRYVGLLLWPGRLSADYSYNQIPLFRLGDWAGVAAAAAALAMAAAAVWAFRRHNRVFFFLGLFFVTLAPTCNVFLPIGTIMAERFLYLPALALAGCVALGLEAASRRLPAKAAPALLGAICAALAVRTYVRNLDWATDQTLMASAAEACPAAYRPHLVLATLLSGSEGVAEADRARATLDPVPDERNFGRAYNSLGIRYREDGDSVAARNAPEAEAWYRKSRDTLLRARSIEAAAAPGTGAADISFELGRTYLRLAQPREALDAFEQARLRSLRPELFEEMAKAYRALGDLRQASVMLSEGALLDREEARFPAELLHLYGETDPGSCAALRLDVKCPLVKERFCAAYRDLEQLATRSGLREAAEGEAASARDLGCPAE